MTALLSKFVTIRLPFTLYDKLKASALANTRSVSAEIVHILKKALD